MNTPPFNIPSVALESDTVPGYPEITYFKDEYFMPNISAAN
jgi:hypothetical protein